MQAYIYRRYTVFKETPTYQLLHSSINAKNQKVGLPVLLHRIVMKVSRDQIRKVDRTEKHDSNFGKLRTKKSRFVSKTERFHFFFNCQRRGRNVDFPSPSLAYATGAYLRDLAPGEHRNVTAVASLWRPCADLTGPGIDPQTFRTDSLCA